MTNDEPCVKRYIVWYILYVILIYNWRKRVIVYIIQYIPYNMMYLYVILYGCKNYTQYKL